MSLHKRRALTTEVVTVTLLIVTATITSVTFLSVLRQASATPGGRGRRGRGGGEGEGGGGEERGRGGGGRGGRINYKTSLGGGGGREVGEGGNNCRTILESNYLYKHYPLTNNTITIQHIMCCGLPINCNIQPV